VKAEAKACETKKRWTIGVEEAMEERGFGVSLEKEDEERPASERRL
jgi:hypothetical protein